MAVHSPSSFYSKKPYITASGGGAGTTGATGPTGPAGPTGPGTNIRQFLWVIINPTAGGFAGPRITQALTATRVSGFVVGGTSIDFNIEERDSATPNNTGTDVLSSDLQVTLTGANSSSFGNSGLATDNWLWLDISNVNGAVTQLNVTLDVTIV